MVIGWAPWWIAQTEWTSLVTQGAMNLLRRGGYRSIRQGLRELTYGIQGMLALGGVASRASST